MLLFWVLVVALGVMTFFPETGVARWLRRWLVEKPAAWISGLTPVKLLTFLIAVPAMVVIFAAAPELLPLIATMGDAGLMLEVLLMVWLASVAGGFRGAWRRVRDAATAMLRIARQALPRRRAARRRKRPAVRPPPKPGDSIDEPGFGWAFA